MLNYAKNMLNYFKNTLNDAKNMLKLRLTTLNYGRGGVGYASPAMQHIRMLVYMFLHVEPLQHSPNKLHNHKASLKIRVTQVGNLREAEVN